MSSIEAVLQGKEYSRGIKAISVLRCAVLATQITINRQYYYARCSSTATFIIKDIGYDEGTS